MINTLAKKVAEHPIFVLGAFFVSILLSLYLYFAAEKKPFLSLYEVPQHALIASPQDNSGISMSLNGERLIENVYATQFYVWNSGNETLRPENVWKDVKIIASDNVKIYSVKILKLSRESINFSISFAQKNKPREIGLKWKFLEPSDGAIIQVIHSYDKSKSGIFKAQGEIEKQDAVNLTSSHIRKDGTYIEPSSIVIYTLLAVVAFVGVFAKKNNIAGRVFLLLLSAFFFVVVFHGIKMSPPLFPDFVYSSDK